MGWLVSNWQNVADNLAIYGVRIFCSVAVYFIFSGLLTNRSPSRNPADVISFFELKDILSRGRRLQLNAFISVPFALLFLYTTTYSQEWVQDLIKHIAENVDQSWKDFVVHMPVALYPLFILISLVIFWPYLRLILIGLRDAVLIAFRIGDDMRVVVAGAAAALTLSIPLEQAQDRLQQRYGEPLPVPTELCKRTPMEILSYQILYFSLASGVMTSFRGAVESTLKSLGSVDKLLHPQPH